MTNPPQRTLSIPPPLSVPEASPDRLGAIAHVFGLTVPSLKGARVLELACGVGANLIPWAARYPEASFIGWDDNSDTLSDARQLAGVLKLKNVSFELGELPETSKQRFDFIIAHNLLSRLTSERQEKLMGFVGASLSDEGLAYLSYQTLPGWYTSEGIRRALQLHVSGIPEEKEKVAQARALLDFLATSMGERTDPYAQLVVLQNKRAKNLGDGLFFQEFLCVHSTPRFFHEVCALADRHQLRFMGESNFVAMNATDLPPKTVEALRTLSGGVVVMEQYLDFIRNRAFRHSIFCRKPRQPQRTVEPERISALSFATPFRAPEKLDLTEGTEVVFHHPGGAEVRVSGTLIKRVLKAVGEAWPSLRTVAEIEARLKTEGGGTVPEKAQLCAALLEGYRQGVFEARLQPPSISRSLAVRPTVWPVARHQASRYQAVTNLRHESVIAPDTVRPLLGLMDGTRDKRAMVLEVEKLVAAGVLVERDDRPADAREKLVDQAIAFALAHALLSA